MRRLTAAFDWLWYEVAPWIVLVGGLALLIHGLGEALGS